MFKAHRLLCHSTLGSKVMKKADSTWPSWRQSLSRKHLASSGRKGSCRLAHLGQIPLCPYHVCVKECCAYQPQYYLRAKYSARVGHAAYAS